MDKLDCLVLRLLAHVSLSSHHLYLLDRIIVLIGQRFHRLVLGAENLILVELYGGAQLAHFLKVAPKFLLYVSDLRGHVIGLSN